MKRYERMPDTRPRDAWGVPMGPKYEDKDWSELLPDEMKADFEWKSDLLAVHGEEVDCDTFYQDYLFRELYEGKLGSGYKVLLTEYDAEASKVHKVDIEDIHEYLSLDDIALSPCLFRDNWRRKSLLDYVGAFVLDIDRLRPMQLQRFLSLFDEQRLLLPTFIANSGSGVHFYYLLDKMLPCDSREHEACNQAAMEIYKNLYDDVIKKEKWRYAQRHWIGQDYRVVNSRTKFHQTARIFKVGEVYTIEELIAHYGVKIDLKKSYASQPMIKYASNIAKDLKIDPPDYTNAKETYNFIRDNKDAAYQVRAERKKQREAKKSKKSVTWYKNTLNYMLDHTEVGYRFSSMKALAIIAFKENVPKEVFMNDLKELAAYWETFDWKGDRFNQKNVEAIGRLFDNAAQYSNTSSEKLEEWLGYEFKKIGVKRNHRPQSVHLKLARNQLAMLREMGEVSSGRPENSGTKQEQVQEWKKAHPDGRKIDCHRETGLSRVTIDKWW